jgi:hypothetical protein
MSLLRGIARLAGFRADGFEEFVATPLGFLNSLAPMLAFPLVGGVILLLGGAVRDGLGNIFASLVALLAPPVLSHVLARRWRREAAWLRYAVAYNWCQAAMTLAAVVLVAALLSAVMAGQPVRTPLALVVIGLALYWLVLCWFLASRGLGVAWWRAVLLVLFVNIGTGLLVMLPRIAAGMPGP